MLESSSGSKPACPEPKDNPPTQEMPNQFNSVVKYPQSQKLENTLSTSQQHTDNVYTAPNQLEVTITQTQKQPSAVFSTIPMSDLSSFDFSALNNQINAFNVIGTVNANNPNVWAMANTPQFVVAPTIPLVNQSQATLNVGYNPFLQDHQAVAPRFTSHSNMQNGQRRFNPARNRGRQGLRYGRYNNRSRPPLHTTDLRQRLSLKRQKETLALNTSIEDSEYEPLTIDMHT